MWPAVFFHSFHNTISQWLFPRLFAGAENEFWLGETGILPGTLYVLVGMFFYAWTRWRGPSWQVLTQRALNLSTGTAGASAALPPPSTVRR